jgi:hypothetical protein
VEGDHAVSRLAPCLEMSGVAGVRLRFLECNLSESGMNRLAISLIKNVNLEGFAVLQHNTSAECTRKMRQAGVVTCAPLRFWMDEECPKDLEIDRHLWKVRIDNVVAMQENVDFSDDQIGDYGVIALAMAFERNEWAPKCLHFRSCELSEIGLKSLVAMLRNNCSLNISILAFGNNVIGDIGARALADALKSKSCSLETLNLNSCGITDDGAIALASTLQQNT